MLKKLRWTLTALLLVSAAIPSIAAPQLWRSREASDQSVVVAHNGRIEVAFSPEGGAEDLVLKTINSAQREIRLLAYSFTAAGVVEALLAAKSRGVDVQVVVDHRSNVTEDQSGKARHALAALINAGVPVRTVAAWPIQHSKLIVVDRRHVETGSYNFSAAAANRNSENVLVVWDNPALATAYLRHWTSRFDRGEPFRLSY